MRLVSGLVIALCGGCFSKPSFTSGGDDVGGDDGGPRDAAADAACTFGAWSSFAPIPELNGEVTGEPTITRDRRLVYWNRQLASSDNRIYWADRSNPAGTFSVRSDSGIPTSGIDTDPAITDDGLTMIYRAGATENDVTFMQATRTSRTQATWTVAPLSSLALEKPATIELSGDGKTVYWAIGGMDLYSATRTSSTSDDFAAASKTKIATGIRWPSISGDQLTLYYLKNTNDVWQMTRDAPTSAFGNPMELFAGAGNDPDVTSDGTAIVIGVNSTDLSIATRSCP